jgi:GAF domain-containing protein
MDTMLTEYQSKDRKITEVAKEFGELKSHYSIDTQYFSSQRAATLCAVDSLSFAIGKIRNAEAQQTSLSNDDIKEMVHSLIWPLVVYREALFSFAAGTWWNIALYQPNKKGELVPEWRKCDARITVKNRSWKPGFGLVGISYLHKTIKYYADIKKNIDNDHNTVSDMETYRSIIAVPVIACEDSSNLLDHNPLGVFIITSSEPEQFNLDRDAVFLKIYANLMAILLEKVQTYSENTKADKVKEGEQCE